MKHIRATWPKKWQEPAIRRVRKLWVQYREKFPVSRLEGADLDLQGSSRKALDEFQQLAKDVEKKYSRPSSEDEFEDYCSRDLHDIGQMPAVYWWSQDEQRKRWPRLSSMAIDILSIPAMSDEPERVFSGGRRTVSWERARMGAETLEICECLKHSRRNLSRSGF
jgi:hypothetical protein